MDVKANHIDSAQLKHSLQIHVTYLQDGKQVEGYPSSHRNAPIRANLAGIVKSNGEECYKGPPQPKQHKEERNGQQLEVSFVCPHSILRGD